jgi:hypothetical protein
MNRKHIVTTTLLLCSPLLYSTISPSSLAFAQGNNSTTIKAAWPLEIGLYSVAPNDSIVTPKANFTAKIPLKNTSSQKWSGSIRFALVDFYEKERAVVVVKATLAAGESKTENVTFVVPEQGVFRVSARLESGGKVHEKDVASVAAFPDRTNNRNNNSFFGSHVNSFIPPLMNQAARLGIAWNRGHNMIQYTWWPRVQPERGEYKWLGETQRSNVKASGMQVLGQFFGTPYWAKRDTPRVAPENPYSYPSGDVPDFQAWREYVFQTVKHHPEIRHWEIWNEPDVSFFWRGSTDDMAKIAQVASEAVKAADPTATVMAAGFTGSGFAWHKAMAKAGAFKDLDGVSFHGYYSATDIPETLEANLTRLVTHFRELPKLSGVEKPPVLWDTESGSTDTTFVRPDANSNEKYNWREAAITSVQSSAMLQSLGVVRSFNYLWNNVNPNELKSANALDRTGAPKPKTIARAVLQQLVDGGWHAGTIKRDEGRLSIHAYQLASDRTVLVWWTGRGGKVRIKQLKAIKPTAALNIMGNPIGNGAISEAIITEEPSYLICAQDAATVLKELSTYGITLEQAPLPLPKASTLLTPQVPELVDYGPANRKFTTIDLRKQANMGLADEVNGDGKGGSADEGPLNDMRDLQTGLRTFYGVPFDIVNPDTNGGKSIITLRGRNVTPNHPDKVNGITIGGKASTLYFLHTAAWGVPGVIGRYVVHYSDGQTVDIPLLIPKEVNDTGNTNNWHTGAVGGEEGRPIPFLVSNTLNGDPAFRYLRCWEWKNPRPEVSVESFDFISNAGTQSPMLIAVTKAE